MLVIRRRPGEALVIGTGPGAIEIEVLESTSSYVKLGIRADKSIPVLRKEIQVVGEENHAASRPVAASSLDALLQKLHSQSSHNSPQRR